MFVIIYLEFKVSYVTALSSTLRFLPKNIIQQQLTAVSSKINLFNYIFARYFV